MCAPGSSPKGHIRHPIVQLTKGLRERKVSNGSADRSNSKARLSTVFRMSHRGRSCKRSLAPVKTSMERIRSHLLRYVVTVLLAACSGGSDTPPIVPVTVTPTVASVMVDQQIQLAATVVDAMGNVLAGRTVTWSSSSTAVATVDSLGLVKALALGQVTITATSEGNSGSAALTTTAGLLYKTITAGGRHTCGITAGGNTYCWGDNTSGQLGNATTRTSAAPVLVRGGLPFQNLSAGDGHTCGVTPSGYAYCWGNNSSGQLGNGTTINSTVPALVEGGLGFYAVSAGAGHTCGVTLQRVAYCWGNNTYGQLGDGIAANSAIPVPVASGIGFVEISAGSRHTCGTPGSVEWPFVGRGILCWGDNSSGQLGNGTRTGTSVPVAIPDARLWRGLSAGDNHTCALWAAGTFGGVSDPACWGGNSSGQLGDGTTIDRATPPLEPVTTYGSAGTRFTCSNYCSGDNTYGQLGNGTTTNSAIPVRIAGGLDFQIVSAGGRHACGVVSQPNSQTPQQPDAVYCWGDNGYGQLGNGWTTMSPLPVNVAGGE